MLIIVEGCDGAGKSTFVDMLKTKIEATGDEVEVLHFGPPTQWAVSEYELSLQHYAPGSGKHIICDRFHIGDLIYGPIYRGSSELAGAGLMHVNAWLNRLGAVMCWLDPPIDDLERNLLDRGDDFVQMEHVREICNVYRSIRQTTPLPSHTITRYPEAHDADRLIRFAEFVEVDFIPVAQLKSYVGCRYPNALFVGDQPSAMAGEHVQAFVPWPGRSGQYLLQAIDLLDVQGWGIINSGSDDVKLAHDVLKPQKVIALGEAAMKRCYDREVPCHAGVIHPAYAKRFLSKPVEAYADLLEVYL